MVCPRGDHYMVTSVRVTDVSRTISFPDRHFLDKTFPGQSLSWTDVSRTICINNCESFECSCSKINDELSCAPCTYDYMLLIISLVCIIIFLSLLYQFVSHSFNNNCVFHLLLTKFVLHPLLDYTLYRIVPVCLLQAYN